MLHHVSLGVRDVADAAEFYDAVLGALGYKRTAQYLPYAIAYGEGISEFWILLPHDRKAASSGNGMHVRDPFGNKIEPMLRPATARAASRPVRGRAVVKPKRRTARAAAKPRKRKAGRR